MPKPKILILVWLYLPGFKSGGPVRTLASIVDHLGDKFDFWILTRDRDHGDDRPYPSVQQDAWNDVGRAKVFYSSKLSPLVVRRVVDEVSPDILYLNGYWSTISVWTLFLRRLGLLKNVPIVLAPRGDLAPGAMAIRSRKKAAYRTLATTLGIYDDLLWHASSAREKSEIIRALGAHLEPCIYVAPDLNSLPAQLPRRTAQKVPGAASFAFLGRIARMKNLPYLLDRLRNLSGDVSLDIYGPQEDAQHWAECSVRMRTMPANVRVTYHGAVDPDQVQQVLARHDFFALPTLGENFGHVILEAASAGLPVIISDRTQWLSLADQGVGWDLALEAPREWERVLQNCVDAGPSDYEIMSARAHDWGAKNLASPEALAQNVELFEHGGSRQEAVVAHTTLRDN